MIKHTEVMKLALEALTKNSDRVTEIRAKDQAITALREALTSVPDWASEAKEQPAQPQQEPVAWAFLNGQYAHIVWGKQRPDDEIHTIPLYTSPQAQQEPLMDDEILAANYPDGEENGPTIAAPDFELICFARQIEAKLKEKNT